MKLLFISKYATFPQVSYPSRQFFICSEIARQGWEVMLVGSRSVPHEIPSFWRTKKIFREENLNLVLINGPAVNLGFNVRRIVSWILFELGLAINTRIFRRFQPDAIVVSSLSILTFIYAVLLKKLLRIPLVIEVRDIYPETLVAFGKFSRDSLVTKILAWIERLAYSNADLLISPLEKFGEHASAILSRPVSFMWLPMGMDPYFSDKVCDPHSIEVRDYIARIRREGAFVVTYAGSHGLGDRLDTILRIANLLRDSKISFVLIGDGPEKKGLVKKYGHLPNVKFFSPVPKADVVGVIGESSLLINLWHNVPLYRFGVSPNKWIDYCLAKRPFLTNLEFDLETTKRLPNCFIIKGDSDIQLADEIRRIAELPEFVLNEMGVRGCEYVKTNLQYSNLSNELMGEISKIVAVK